MTALWLAAVALLCWPSRPAVQRLVESAPEVSPTSPPHGRKLSTGRGPRGWFAGRWRVAGRPGWVLGVVVIGAGAVPAGPAAMCAATLVATTLALITSSELRRRRDSRQIGRLLEATRTLAREVRAGAAPVTAVLATAAAHPACTAALDQLAVTVVGRRHGSAPPAAGPPARRGERVDGQAEVLARLGDGWELSARHGVPWATLIDTVAVDLAERQRAESLRNAQVAGPRVSGYVLAVLPALGILLGAGMGADPVHVLLHTGVGAVLLLVGSSLTCLGLAWTASIVRR